MVKKGDTGFSIAFEYGVPFADIATANGIAEDARLTPGQRLIIPAVIDMMTTSRSSVSSSDFETYAV